MSHRQPVAVPLAGALAAVLVALLPCRAASATAPVAEAVWDTLAGPIDPTPSSAPVTVRDAARHRMVVIDGFDPTSIWSMSLAGSSSLRWSLRHTTGPFPYRRSEQAAFSDSARDRILVFGGDADGIYSYNDLWSLSLGDSPTWTRLDPTGAPPPAGYAGCSIFDTVRDRMLVVDDTMQVWALDVSAAPEWRKLDVAGGRPAPRGGASAAYDPRGRRLLLFGGYADVAGRPCNGEGFNDTWALNLDGDPQWRRLVTASPPSPRMKCALVVDPLADRLVLQGGVPNNCTGGAWDPNQAWELPLSGSPTWHQLPDPPAEQSLGGLSFILCPERGSVIRYGGAWNGCFELRTTSAEWSAIEPPAPDPYPVRRPAALVLPDPDGNGMRVLGGICRHDLWHFARGTPSPWTPLPSEGASPTCGAAYLVYDARRNRLINLGTAYSYPENWRGEFEVHELPLDSPRAWKAIPTQGEPPGSLLWFSMIEDPVRDRVLLFGGGDQIYPGDDCAQDSDTVWQLSLGDTCRWQRLVALHSPGARDFHTAVYDPHGDRMIVFGGEFQAFGNYCFAPLKLRDTWALTLGAGEPTWTLLDPAAPIPTATAVLDTLRDRLLVLAPDMTAWALSLSDPRGWQPITITGQPPGPRDRPGVAFDQIRDELVVYGGMTNSDVYALRFLSPPTRQVELVLGGSGNAPAHALGGGGPFAAALLGARSFCVDSVVVASLRLAGAPVRSRGRREAVASRRDVNRDGILDLVFEVDRAAMHLTPGDSVAEFTAEAVHGTRLVGSLRLRSLPGQGTAFATSGEEEPASAEPALRVLGPRRSGNALSLEYRLPSAVRATLSVYDVAGRRVAWREFAPEPNALGRWSLDEMRGRPSGVYFVKLVQSNRSATARAILLP